MVEDAEEKKVSGRNKKLGKRVSHQRNVIFTNSLLLFKPWFSILVSITENMYGQCLYGFICWKCKLIGNDVLLSCGMRYIGPILLSNHAKSPCVALVLPSCLATSCIHL